MDTTDIPAGGVLRRSWLALVERLADPVLTAFAAGSLRADMPVEQQPGAGREVCSHLEAVGRLFAGLAPFLGGEGGDADELALRRRLGGLLGEGLRRELAAGPAERQLDLEGSQQAIVDAAFLAQGVLRAPGLVRAALGEAGCAGLAARLARTRARKPLFNNWLLFAATTEAAIGMLGGQPDAMRVDYALRQHEQWYVGDGAYGDGPAFHWDYYNSFVIQPMLVDVLAAMPLADWDFLREPVRRRATRWAAVQERMVAPDGSFPPIGRSLAYRCGAFQSLAQAALLGLLPDAVPPEQARSALAAVVGRTLDAPGTWDARGWLTIGLCGRQPGLGERYISTGSLYLCSAAFLPLGLPASDRFWSGPPTPWTARRLWSGMDAAADHAL